MSILNLLLGALTAVQALIPMPQQAQWDTGTFDLTSPYRVENTCSELSQNLYLQDFLQGSDATSGRMCIITCEALPMEGYRLHITADTLLIAARDAAGFLHAGQTLQQLSRDGKLPCCDINDAPRFEWRGCMIDVSRHYYDIDCLKRQIDILASMKLNRLHLHLTDAAGWRLQIDRYPLLTQIAAWRTQSD